MSMIDYDRRMLADRVRNDAFAAALRSVIVPGITTVSDIGAGTGFLSFLAARLGAKACIGYEFSPIIRVARELAKENALAQCRFVEEHTSEVPSPEQTDVVVTETFGNFLTEEHLVENLQDAQRCVKPGGVIIPGRITQYACPIVSPRHFDEITAWRMVGHGLTFAAAEQYSLNNMYVRDVRPDDLWGEPAAYDTIVASEDLASRRKAEVRFVAERDRTVYGAAVWWEAELVPDVILSTSPHDPPTHWQQIVLPVLEPIALRKGDALRLRIVSDTRLTVGLRVGWNFAVLRDGREVLTQDLDLRRGRVEE